MCNEATPSPFDLTVTHIFQYLALLDVQVGSEHWSVCIEIMLAERLCAKRQGCDSWRYGCGGDIGLVVWWWCAFPLVM